MILNHHSHFISAIIDTISDLIFLMNFQYNSYHYITKFSTKYYFSLQCSTCSVYIIRTNEQSSALYTVSFIDQRFLIYYACYESMDSFFFFFFVPSFIFQVRMVIPIHTIFFTVFFYKSFYFLCIVIKWRVHVHDCIVVPM